MMFAPLSMVIDGLQARLAFMHSISRKSTPLEGTRARSLRIRRPLLRGDDGRLQRVIPPSETR